MPIIRQEINLLSEQNTVNLSGLAISQLDTTIYAGSCSYYFEIGFNDTISSGGKTASLIRTSGVSDASIGYTAPINSSVIRKQFNPPSGKTDYKVSSVGSNTLNYNVAKIIILQNINGNLTSTQTQFDIGNRFSTTSLSATNLTFPKYFHYDSSEYDGNVSIFFEASGVAGNSKSGLTVQLQMDNGSFSGWTLVAGSTITITSLTAVRSRTAAITLTSGRNYRVVIFSGTSKSASTIYSAKIIINQTGYITKTVTYNYSTSYAQSNVGIAAGYSNWNNNDWIGVTNTNTFVIDVPNGTASGVSSILFPQISTVAGSYLTNSTNWKDETPPIDLSSYSGTWSHYIVSTYSVGFVSQAYIKTTSIIPYTPIKKRYSFIIGA